MTDDKEEATVRSRGSMSRPRRAITDGSARSNLLALLGEFVYPNNQQVWTSSLLYMMVGMGIEPQTARQAIARASNSGWIEGTRQGREVRWELTSAGKKLFAEGTKRIYALHADAEPWDGTWLVLLVSIPESQRAVRKRLYTALKWEGFGNPTAGVWVSPHLEKQKQAKKLIDNMGLSESTLAFAGQAIEFGQMDEETVRYAWDLAEVTEKYERLLVRYSGLEPAAGDPLLFSHVQLVNEWQHFPSMDPQLPEDLLPNWIGRRAAVMFHQLRDSWYDAAQQRWQEVVKETSPN